MNVVCGVCLCKAVRQTEQAMRSALYTVVQCSPSHRAVSGLYTSSFEPPFSVYGVIMRCLAHRDEICSYV